jgi:hypothetical protein
VNSRGSTTPKTFGVSIVESFHVEDDQIVTIKASAGLAAVIVVDATLKASPGRSHMVPETKSGRFNSDVLTLDHA